MWADEYKQVENIARWGRHDWLTLDDDDDDDDNDVDDDDCDDEDDDDCDVDRFDREKGEDTLEESQARSFSYCINLNHTF